MPVLRGAVTYSRFRAEPKKPRGGEPRRWVGRALRAKAFEPIDRASDEDRALGWVQVEDSSATEFAPADVFFGEHMLVSIRVDRLRVPASVVKTELELWARKLTESRGHPPKRSEKKHERELIEKKLRARAFIQTRTYDLSWNLRSDEVAIWATAPRLVEEIAEIFEESFEHRLHALSPGVRAEQSGAPEGSLAPTAALIGRALEEVSRGAA